MQLLSRVFYTQHGYQLEYESSLAFSCHSYKPNHQTKIVLLTIPSSNMDHNKLTLEEHSIRYMCCWPQGRLCSTPAGHDLKRSASAWKKYDWCDTCGGHRSSVYHPQQLRCIYRKEQGPNYQLYISLLKCFDILQVLYIYITSHC